VSEQYSKQRIRIPVKLVDGVWEFFYGGALPIRPNCIADLVLDKASIADPSFLSLLRRRTDHKILAEGTELLVALTLREGVSAALTKHILPRPSITLGPDYYSTPRPSCTAFVSITVGKATQQQSRNGVLEGGVWLRVEGAQPKGLFSSSIRVPHEVFAEPVESLNHAFSKLSEKYEPWRISHTGSVYTRVLYQEENRKWYPIDVLRDAALARDEHQLVRQQWDKIRQQIFANDRLLP
jgi:hypothetical protein